MKTDTDYIREAVELAEGFTLQKWHFGEMLKIGSYVVLSNHKQPLDFSILPQWFKDALAAQLVRQVDALPDTTDWDDLISMNDCSGFFVWTVEGIEDALPPTYDQGRTINTIRNIVDSGVLKVTMPPQ